MRTPTYALSHGQVLQPIRAHAPTTSGTYYIRVPKTAGEKPEDWRKHYVKQLQRRKHRTGRDEYLLRRLSVDGWLPVIRVTRYRDEGNRLKRSTELAVAPANYRWRVNKNKPTARQQR